MNIYQIQDLELEPILIMTDNRKDAVAEFHFAILRAFGYLPTMNFALFQTDPDLLPETKSLEALMAKDQTGFANLSSSGWKRSPFDEEWPDE
ncbi:hypothetical protein GRI34_12485 [Erythrobacter aquimaris]|uniref:Uncharacterized protein n=1 Tax=Qipengyuania aquimaris TaxID=255984 RepID=A0A6I4TMH4_9SPHN|nr:hypothetical protein [Qipengyuania aquimaris]MXO97235.1 hypothetical protein [Qipengyuania aquimaris]